MSSVPFLDIEQMGAIGSLKVSGIVTQILQSFEDRFPPLARNDATGLDNYCGITGSVNQGETLATATASSDKTPVARIGVPVVLTALAPLPGATLPELSASGIPASTLPSTATVSFQWHIQIEGTNKDSRPGLTVDDQGGAFDCVVGNLNSPVLELIPWPDPNHIVDIEKTVIPSRTQRSFSAYAEIKFWWPGLTEPAIVQTKQVFFKVQAWGDIIDPNQIGSALNIKDDGDFYPSQFFRNIFELTVNTTEPAVGELVKATIKRSDYKPVLPQTVTSMVQSDPNVKIQAGIDLSAVLGGIFEKIAKDVEAATGSSSNVFDSAVNLQKVLDGLISVPVAIAINGTSMAKTIVPNSPVTLPDLVSSPDGTKYNGIVPIGKLTTKLDAVLDQSHLKISPAVDDDKNAFIRQGLSILPLPVFSPMKADGTGILQPKSIKLNVSFKTSLTVPGSSKPLSINCPLPDIVFLQPVIPIPQMALMFKDRLDNNPIQDVYITPDPVTAELTASTDRILEGLGTVNSILQNLITVKKQLSVNTIQIQTGFDSVEALAAVVSRMVKQLNDAKSNIKTTTILTKYSLGNTFWDKHMNTSDNLTAEFTDGWWDGLKNFDHPGNISAFLWIGAPIAGTYRMWLGLDNFTKPTGRLAFPGKDSSIHAVACLNAESTTSIDGVGRQNEDSDTLFPDLGTYNDNMRWVEWQMLQP